MNWRLLILVGLNVAVLAAGWSVSHMTVDSQSDYPQRPIELVVPFSHGGGTDTFARIIEFAIKENDLLPQPLTVINRGGAGATIGSRFVKDAEPDGYTLLVLHDAMITAKHSGMVDYGPEAFEVIAGTGELGMVIAVSEDSPFRSLDDVLQAAKSQPETIRFGANLGALTHFAGMQLEKEIPGAKFLFPQVGGGADRFGDLIGEHIDVTGFSIEEFHRFHPAGLRGLAYLGPERHPAYPNLPTAQELGYDVVNTNMFFWWFPKGTPAEAVQVIREALRKAMQTEFVQGKLAEIQADAAFLTGAELQDRIAQAERRFAGVGTRPQSVMLNLPWGLLACAVGLTAVAGVQHWRSRRSDEPAEPGATAGLEDDAHETDSPGATRRAVICLTMTALYVIALVGGVGFTLSTIVFVPAVGSLLIPNARAPQVLALWLLGQCLGFGLDVVFTKLFDVSLP